MRFSLCLALCFSLASFPAFADKRHEELKKIEANLQDQQRRDKELDAKTAGLSSQMEETRSAMIELSQDMQSHEQAVLKMRQAKAVTEKEIDTTKEKLEGQRTSLAQIIMAMQRLDRVPPQALLLRPSAPIDMARSFELLRQVIPAVSAQAAEIKETVTHLEELHETQQVQENQLVSEQAELKKKQASLENLLKKRQKILAQTKAEQEASHAKSMELASQAKDLRDLMDRIARESDERVQRRQNATTAPADNRDDDLGKKGHNLVKSLTDWFGKVTSRHHLPVAGDVTTGYGESTPGGGQSQGLTIRAAPGSIVTAPGDGVVRFAGPFRQYKLLVIIQHSGGEHSLLGGMQELYTQTGAKVAAGEPLGKLPKLEGDSTAVASLYYERRRNGKAVDPRQ